MKIKATLCGASLLLLTTLAYGLDSQGVSSAQAPAPAQQSGAMAGPGALSPSVQAIRANIARAGVDPDSENGQILVQWSARIVNDSNLRAKLAGMSRHPFGDAPVSADDRLRLLYLTKDIITASPGDCHALAGFGSNFFAMVKGVSPRTLQDLLEVVDILILAPGQSEQKQEEPYSFTELLDAAASPALSEQPDLSDIKDSEKTCATMASLIDRFIALPEPLRERTTYMILQKLRKQKLPQDLVLEQPFAYLDDVFDERRLPEAMRRRLPADGSVPLPYSRLTIDANWVNKTKPALSMPFKDIFINRRDNGVIAELTTTVDQSGATNWAAFALSYGITDMVSRTIGNNVTTLDTASDDASIVAASQSFVQGEHVDVPAPQQPNEARKQRRCEVGQILPASSVFGSLTGSATRMSCTQVNEHGTTITLRGAWLSDYGIFWVDSIDDEYGRTDAIVNNVTIQTNSPG